MIFNVSGGGTALNFRVVGGTTAPANPAENCIWVNTDTPITSWIFSATEPSPAEAGMVWISTGTSSNIEFNALKKNGIQVYPLSAKQYVSGAWVAKTAKSYQGGAWRSLIRWLYNKGDECTDITGGWGNNIMPGGGTVTKNTDSITISGTSNATGVDFSTETIDLSGLSTITMHSIAHSNQTGGGVSLRVYQVGTGVVASANTTGETTILDLSGKGFSGKNYRVAIVAYLATITVDEVYMA